MRGDERAGNLEDQIADEEDACTGAEYLRRDPRQILDHRELGVCDVDAVDTSDDRDEEDRQDNAQVAQPLQAAEIDVFHSKASMSSLRVGSLLHPLS